MEDVANPKTSDNEVIAIDLHPVLIDGFKDWLDERGLKLFLERVGEINLYIATPKVWPPR